MEYKKITIEVPILKIKENVDIFSYDWAKDNTPNGMYVLDNGIVHFFCFRHHDYSPQCFEIPTDVVKAFIAHEAQGAALASVAAALNSMLETLKGMDNKTQFIIDEIDHIEEESKNYVNEVSTRLQTAIENAKTVGQSSAASPLEIAKALAVIQQPELIKELR